MWPLALGLAVVWWFLSRQGSSPSGSLPAGDAGLSPLRQRAGAILQELVPSAYPDARFMRIVGASFDPMASDMTTCGALPGRLGVLLGDKTGITKFGVPGVETEGKARKAWVEPGAGRLPKLGDIFLTAFVDGPRAGEIAHTGVVKTASDHEWVTADAGQGTHDHPRAEIVHRVYDPVNHTLSRNGQIRRLVGWIDLDLAMAHMPAHAFVPARLGEPWPCDPAECT